MLDKIGIAVVLLLAADVSLAAKTCTLTIEGNDQMKFNLTEMRVKADCTDVEVVLKHVGKLAKQVMGHNWVLTKTGDFMGVVNAGVKAGPERDYLPEKDARIIAHTKMLGGGESDSVKFSKSKLTKGGDYTFFCSFPGHYALMKGRFIVE